MAGSPPNFHKMDSRSACIQDVLKVKVKVKGHVIRELSWILGMSYSVIDGLVCCIMFICYRLSVNKVLWVCVGVCVYMYLTGVIVLVAAAAAAVSVVLDVK